MNPAIKFSKPLSLGVMIAAQRAWKLIMANDRLLLAGTISEEEWYRRRDVLAAEIKAKGG